MTSDKSQTVHLYIVYLSPIDGRPFSEIYARQLISKISREELEDKYLRLQEDNQVRLIKLLFFFFLFVFFFSKIFKNLLMRVFQDLSLS